MSFTFLSFFNEQCAFIPTAATAKQNITLHNKDNKIRPYPKKLVVEVSICSEQEKNLIRFLLYFQIYGGKKMLLSKCENYLIIPHSNFLGKFFSVSFYFYLVSLLLGICFDFLLFNITNENKSTLEN